MKEDRKALYNLLRMNWLNDPTSECEPWQVEDYRALDTSVLFDQLALCGLPLDKLDFIALSNSFESPEDLLDSLLEGIPLEPIDQDRIYLLVFELWRRLIPEKLCLSVFCDELDHQIFLFDSVDPNGAETIQDAVANLQMILVENVDQGIQPEEIFDSVKEACANDLESFLYDYIADQLDSENTIYAAELLEGFEEFLSGSKYFQLLKIRLLEETDPDSSKDLLSKLVQKAAREDDLPFNIEVLAYLAINGDKSEFKKMVKKTVPLLKSEDDFQDLLGICIDYYSLSDKDQKEQQIEAILARRESNVYHKTVDSNDPDLNLLLKIIK